MVDGNSDSRLDNQRRILGEFIKSQRKLARMSLRDLAERTNISNPYLSQIERGLHEPSVRILKAISNALNVSLNSLLSQLGHTDESTSSASESGQASVEVAIYSDQSLSQYQKEVLVATYRTFVSTADRKESARIGRHDPKIKKPKRDHTSIDRG